MLKKLRGKNRKWSDGRVEITDEGRELGVEIALHRVTNCYCKVVVSVPGSRTPLRMVAGRQPPRFIASLEIPAAEAGSGKRAESIMTIPLMGSGETFEIPIWLYPDEFDDRLKPGRLGPEVGKVRGSRKPVGARIESQFLPVQVCSLGRSGSTFMMQLLSNHPELHVPDAYPYEYRISAYFARVFNALVMAPSGAETVPLEFTNSPRIKKFVGPNPYFRESVFSAYGKDWQHEWYEEQYPREVATFCKEQIDSFYRAFSGKNSGYYIEKLKPDAGIQGFLEELYPGLCRIVLVRDFRDWLCSSRSFWKGGAERWTRAQMRSKRREIRELERMAEQSDSIVVKYEDLVSEPEQQLARVLDFIGMEGKANEDALVRNARKGAKKYGEWHKTSRAESTGRWKEDLDDVEQELANEIFSKSLKFFGYET